MALSDEQILKEIKEGDIFISPFKDAHLATSSYDVSLGEYFFREKKREPHKRYYHIWSKSDTDEVWGTDPERAPLASDIFDNPESHGIMPDERVILIEPGETILAHTQEYIGGRNTVTTMMKARSSLGRNFIEVCKCAGWGDVGYINRWTMEITNNSRHYVIPLIVGRRIAQIVFFKVGKIRNKDYTKTGKYQTSEDIKAVMKNWDPRQMLPKLYKDSDKLLSKKKGVAGRKK